jgi:hypothetical protein
VITDAELAAAVTDRAHWQPAGASAAVYAAPGSPVSVRVQRIHHPARPREAFVASVIRDGRATSVVPFGTADQAVRWAERVRSG